MLNAIVQKGKALVDWLDGVPSVPAAAGAFVVGVFVPTKLLVLVGVVLAGYLVFKLAGKE